MSYQTETGGEKPTEEHEVPEPGGEAGRPGPSGDSRASAEEGRSRRRQTPGESWDELDHERRRQLRSLLEFS